MALSFQQEQKFPKKPDTVEQEIKLDGGVVLDVDDTKLETNQASKVENFLVDKGSVSLRPGFSEEDLVWFPQGEEHLVDSSPTDTTTISIDTKDTLLAQTFTLSSTELIRTINLELGPAPATAANDSTRWQDLRIEIWSTAAGVPDEMLYYGPVHRCQSDIKAHRFLFLNPLAFGSKDNRLEALSAGTYAIVLRPGKSNNNQFFEDGNTIEVKCDDTNPYAGGQTFKSTDGGDTWVAMADYDLQFELYSSVLVIASKYLEIFDNNIIYSAQDQEGFTGGTGATTSMMGSPLLAGGTFPEPFPYRLPYELPFYSVAPGGFYDSTVAATGTLLVSVPGDGLSDSGSSILKLSLAGSTGATGWAVGTIGVQPSIATITASGASWIGSVFPGQYIQLPNTKWYKIASVNSATSLTVETRYPSPSLSGQSYIVSSWGSVEGDINSTSAPADLTVPKPQYIANHRGRIWALDDDTLYWSVVDTTVDGEYFNDWDTNSGDGNGAGQLTLKSESLESSVFSTGLLSFKDVLYIFRSNGIWALYGATDPNEFELRNISKSVGCIDHRTIVETDQYIIFLSTSGIYVFDGSNLVNVSVDKVNSLIDELLPRTITNIYDSPVQIKVGAVAATMLGDYYVLSFSYANGTPPFDFDVEHVSIWFNTKTGVYTTGSGMDSMYWAKTTPISGRTQVWYKTVPDTPVSSFFSHPFLPVVGRVDWSVHNDGGYPIDATYETGWWDIDSRFQNKDIKKVYIQQRSTGYHDMTLQQLLDDGTETASQINLGPGDDSIITTRMDTFNGSTKQVKFIFGTDEYEGNIGVLGVLAAVRTRRLS